MRQLTKVEIERIKILTENSVEITLIEPTKTGLEKSIMDATGSVRIYLEAKGIHDYETQKQGPENKVLVDSYLVTQSELVTSVASLYRPVTKKGDPRIWFKGLGNYAKPNDILGILEFEGLLYVVNITRLDIEKLIDKRIGSPLAEIFGEIKKQSNEVAEELLGLLRQLASKGPVPSLLNADTAVGRTLEKLLGIEINSSKKPDYKGIELKAFRSSKKNRKTLFAQVPDWDLSKFKSSAEILQNFGYKRGNDFKLYCTVSSLTRNSRGLKLRLDDKVNNLIENSDKVGIGDFVVWALKTLHQRLVEKHSETFWIAAEEVRISGKDHFVYKKVEHTKKPILSQFDILIDQGIITLDHLIKRNAKGKVVEKGPLFKIKPNSLGLLFPPPIVHNLL